MISQIKKYLSANLDKYSYESLKKQLLKSGYIDDDICEAKEELDIENSKKHEDVVIFPSPTDSYGDPVVLNPHSVEENESVLEDIATENLPHDEEDLTYLEKEDTAKPKTTVLGQKKKIDLESKHFMNGFLVLFLTVITLGLYIPFWYMRQNDGFVQNDREQVSKGLISVSLVLEFIFIIMVVISIIAFSTNPIGSKAVIDVFNVVSNIVIGIIVIANIVLSFKFREVYKNEYQITSAGFWTFLFGCLYLQVIINKEL